MWTKIDGIKAYEKGGKVYAYCRISGASLQNKPKRINGIWHADAALVKELDDVRRNAPKKLISGSVQDIVRLYREHEVSVRGRKAFCDLSERTQEDYIEDLGRLCGAKVALDPETPKVLTIIGDLKPVDIGTDIARALRDAWTAKHGAGVTGRTMSACSVLWSYALEYSHASTNPWKAIKKPQSSRSKVRANPPWTKTEVLVAIDTAPFIGLARFYVLAYLGIRPQQIPSLVWQDLAGSLRSQKTSTEHHIQIPAAFDHLFSEHGNSVLVSTGPNGLPWKDYNQVSREFGKHRSELINAGLMRSECTLKGLNHTTGAAAAESGLSDAEMEAGMARTRETVRKYSDRANRKMLSDRAFSALSDWLFMSTETEEVSTDHSG